MSQMNKPASRPNIFFLVSLHSASLISSPPSLSHQGLLMQPYQDHISGCINSFVVTLIGSRHVMFKPATCLFAQTPAASWSAIRTVSTVTLLNTAFSQTVSSVW